MANETPGMVCPNCGTSVAPAVRLCPNCGQTMPGMQDQQPWAMSPDVPQGVRQKSGNKVVGWVLGGCAIVALLIVLGLLALCGIITI